jgi:Ni/Fe-hydrogenase subunit HybB-like protein
MLPGVGDVEEMRATMQAAIAPAFLITAIMSALGMLAQRLSRVLDRERAIGNGSAAFPGERNGLAQRAQALHIAIALHVVAALLICLLIMTSFAGPFLGLRTGLLLGIILIVALGSLMAGLACFLQEVRLSAYHLPDEEDS